MTARTRWRPWTGVSALGPGPEPDAAPTDEVELEAGLVIDSINHVQIFARARRQFAPPGLPADLRVAAVTTLTQIAEQPELLAGRALR
jgi:hypothetical protein